MNVNLNGALRCTRRVLPVDGRPGRRRDREPVVDRGLDGGRLLLGAKAAVNSLTAASRSSSRR